MLETKWSEMDDTLQRMSAHVTSPPLPSATRQKEACQNYLKPEALNGYIMYF